MSVRGVPVVNWGDTAPWGDMALQLQLIKEMRDWAPRGLCADPGIESGVFDPENYGEDRKTANLAVRVAKLLCSKCPVLQQCRDHALGFPELAGIWGGLTEGERALLLKERRRRHHDRDR